ncbi:MAG: hypothetical protein ACXABG_02765 [Promethearchaeota archaeon]|jgi:hypothetical protein
MKSRERVSKYNLKKPYASLKVMQRIILEGKQVTQIADEINNSKGYVSKVITPLQKEYRLIRRSEVNNLYYVPVEAIVKEYASRMGFSDKEIELLIQNINGRKGKISKAEIPKSSWKFVNPPLLLAELLWLGLEEKSNVKKSDSLFIRFIYMLRGLFWVDWHFKEEMESWPTPPNIKEKFIKATEEYWKKFAEIYSEWVEQELKQSNE